MEFVPLWTDILDGPNWKILDLPPELYRFWTFCLIAAQKHDFVEGFLPDARTLSRWTGIGVTEVGQLRDRLVTGHVLDRVTAPGQGEFDALYKVHDWEDWRAVKDPTAAKRKRAERARNKRVTQPVTVLSRNGHGPVTAVSEDVTPHTTPISIQQSSTNTTGDGGGDGLVTFGRITFGERFDLESLDAQLAGWRAAKYPDSWIRDAFLVARANSEVNRTASYITTCLRRWAKNGGPDPDEVKVSSGTAPPEYVPPTPEEMEQTRIRQENFERMGRERYGPQPQGDQEPRVRTRRNSGLPDRQRENPGSRRPLGA